MSFGRSPHRRSDPSMKAKNFSSTIHRIVCELSSQRFRLVALVTTTCVAVVTSVAAPSILGQATDVLFSGVMGRLIEGYPSVDTAIAAFRADGQVYLAQMLERMEPALGWGINYSRLRVLLAISLIVYMLSAVASWVSGLLVRSVVQNFVFHIRERVRTKIDRMSLSYLDSHARGDLMSRVSNDVDNVGQVLNQTLAQFIHALFMVLGIISMMIVLSWKLTLVSVLVLPVGMAGVGVLMAKAQPFFRHQWTYTGQVSATVEESIAGHEVAVLYGLEQNFADKMRQSNQALYSAAVRAQFVSNLVMPMMNLMSSITYVVVAVGGGFFVAQGSMTLGGVQAFVQYSRQFMHPLGTLSSMMSSLQSGAASAERVFDFLEAEEMPEENTVQELPTHVAGRVVFENVRFGYSANKPVIKGLSLTVEPGQMVAIVGPTGAGKTTLVNLIMRFYELESGRITLDGVDISKVSREQLRAHVGMVLQDTWLFEGSIAQNIAFGRPGASEDDVVRAAQATSVDRLVRHLPKGYDTVLSEGSESISVGERQLVTIARAFVSEPDILILDEATSSVDTRTEVLVQKAMDRLRHGRTAFVIAHRLSTIRHADLILVMDQGDVVQMGTHDELLAQGGLYARLHGADSVE